MNQNRRFSALSVFASWVFLAIPFFLVLFDWSSAREREFSKLVEIADQNAKTLLERMQVSNNWEYQVVLRLNSFHRRLRSELPETGGGNVSKTIANIYHQSLAPSLPLHHLTVAIKKQPDNSFTTAFEQSIPGEPNLLSNFAPLMSKSCNQKNREKAAVSLRTMCGFPVNVKSIIDRQDDIKNKDEGIIVPFTSRTGSTWLYWFCPDHKKDEILVCAIFKMDKISADYSYKAMTESINAETTGFAVIPVSGNQKIFWSPFLRNQPELQRFLKSESGHRPMKSVRKQFGSFNVYSAPALVGEPSLLMLVTSRVTAIPLTNGETGFVILVLILFAGLSLILLQRKIFRRGWRISIALVLLTAFFSIFYLPAGLGRLVVRYSLDNHLSAMRKKAESDLEKNLQVLEDRYNLTMTDFFYRIHHLENYPAIMQQIAENRIEKALGSIKKQVRAMYPKDVSSSYLMMTLQQDSGENTILMDQNEETQNASEMFATLLKSLLHKFRPELLKKNRQVSEKPSLNEVKDEMIGDFLIKFFQGVLGEEMFFRLTASPTDLVEVDSSFLKISTTSVPIRLSGIIRALLLIMWSEYNEAEDYLNFLIANKSERPDNFDFAAVRKGSFHTYYKSTTPITPEAWDLIERTRRVGIQLTSREQMNTDKRLLIKTRPGNALAMYILAGTTSLKALFDEQLSLEKGLNTLLLIGLLLLALLVASLYWYFMNPLKQLQSGLGQISRGDFQARVAVGNRDDEFGNIGRSFNAMAKGLEEGSLLGKFVSSAVIKVVKDKSAFEKAIRGEKREMTILFASLKIDNNSEAEAFIEQLAFHLKSCQEAVRPTAGVIDKVMENKILVFFDHEACNGTEQAVKQAIATVGTLKQNLSAQNHSGYYGLATGAVVAGILGARNLRLDYTVIGDAVNLSARLNALAADDSGSQIIIDEKTCRQLPDKASAESLGEISIKGKTAPVIIYRI
ncbi:MAG: hypothetical protein A2W80_07755 [Candidatus Riflebacteria bacterium GWC2_50_8]|nr:MAG: hypothetical protein A2W80_07755 [Candidatus Riflebacteria bacterium GWC2_50_8]